MATLTPMGSRGPAPSPTALRRTRDASAWKRLPPHGLTAEHDVPQWPVEFGEQTAEESALWTRLWRTKPAAWAWLEHDLGDHVAIYVRMLILSSRSPIAAQVAETRRMAELLLLTIESMRRGKYEVDESLDGPVNGLDTPELERPTGTDTAATNVVSARDRFKRGKS